MSSAGQSLLVVGGTGFFGKSILDAFARGLLDPWNVDHVIVAARDPEKLRLEQPDLVGERVELIAIDIATATRLPEADFIIHAANTSDARRYVEAPLVERAAIVAAADNFRKLILDGNCRARIVYTSSGAVYGAQPAEVEQFDETMSPDHAVGLATYKRDYAEAKLLAEQAVARLGRDLGVRVAVARCFAFVGPYLPRDQHFAVGNFLADGLAGRPIAVSANHPVIRSYLYADDLVEWLMTIADRASPNCPVFNVGSDDAMEIGEVAQRVAAMFNVPVARGQVAMSPVDRYVPSIVRAREQLGLTPKHDLETALATTVRRLKHARGAVGESRRGASDSALAGTY